MFYNLNANFLKSSYGIYYVSSWNYISYICNIDLPWAWIKRVKLFSNGIARITGSFVFKICSILRDSYYCYSVVS